MRRDTFEERVMMGVKNHVAVCQRGVVGAGSVIEKGLESCYSE